MNYLKPGIVVFGSIVLQGQAFSTFPEANTLPVECQFGDDMNSISTAEFTIFQTMSHNSLYTILSGGGVWDETNDPFAAQQPSSIRHFSVCYRRKRTNPLNNLNRPTKKLHVLSKEYL
ncbi:MAG: hypothetical protein JW915_21630, partial [Chitinispirillaceae bacterium]|nr:hypothetical protein [Chitinispirillaceae bacterium]